MKRKGTLLLILMTIMIVMSGCSQITTITEIDFPTLKEKIRNRESFILEVIQTGCTHCEEFSPRLKKILSDYNLTAFSLNLSNLSSEEKKELKKFTEIDGTPTVTFFNKGEEEVMQRISGSASEKEVKRHLKAMDYID